MRHGSLFSGQGGFDLAAQWMGWENVFHCEINPFCQRILKYYWPNAITHEDIKQTDFTIYRGRIDVLTGGFPCQPYSVAGERKGTEDERHLWPEMLRAIREIAPTWIVGENVRGLISWNGGLVFEQVCSDLEDLSYEVFPIILPAAGLNAPHKRERVWFVAYAGHSESQRRNEFKEGQQYVGRRETRGESSSLVGGGTVTNPDSERLQHRISIEQGKLQGVEERIQNNGEINGSGSDGIAADASDKGLEGRELNKSFNEEGKIGRQQPPRSVAELHQADHWKQFPTQSPVCSGDDGIPSRLDYITISSWRKESIKSGGNAVVPQIPFRIFKAIEQYESR